MEVESEEEREKKDDEEDGERDEGGAGGDRDSEGSGKQARFSIRLMFALYVF